jgi:CheY-like chemotaxis protein
MAELLGAIASGITLAGLLKVCVEAFDVIQHARKQDLDYRKLALRLNIEKCRLYTGGQAMGLTELPRGDSARPLEGHRFEPLIRETMEMIVMLFNDSEKLKDVYGCRSDIEQVCLPAAIESDSIDKLAAAFKNFRIKCSTTDQSPVYLKKAKWAIHDRKKFTMLITENKNLIDGLQEITKSLVSVPRQAGQMKRTIQKIKDVGTHRMLADVCEHDYPELSEASSKATEAASLPPENMKLIQQWTNEVETSDAADQDLEEIESLTFTELKQRYLQLKQKVLPAILPVSAEPQTSQEVHLESDINDRQALAMFDSLVHTPIWTRTPRILLVEDDPSCRLITMNFLRSLNCNVDTAFDSLAAVDKVERGVPYDLILMDIPMPSLDSVLFPHIMTKFDGTPIVAMTSWIRPGYIQIYARHGINALLPKPFTERSLLQMLATRLIHLSPPTLMVSHAVQQGRLTLLRRRLL